MTLRIGMLWFDDAPGRPLADKLQQAARHYERKYGHRPNICYVSRNALEGAPSAADGLQLCAAPDILPHHFWLGIAE
jgi:hypothetical protein